MPSFMFNEAKKEFLNGTLDWDSQNFKAMLVTSGYTPDKDDIFVSELGANELSGSGYVAGFNGAGRVVITGKVVSKDDTTDRAYLDCDDVSWVGINAGTIRALVIIQEVTSDADSKLIAYLQLSADQATNGADIRIKIPTSGWLYI